jgi:nucleobase:cation symporter-1, NCS1 family
MTANPLDAPTTTPPIATDESGVPFDAHGIEPIPDGSRDCSPWELFWIWSGANIAPINWVLGALGITLGLSLVETLLVVVGGNVIGCAVFGAFNVIGHRTAVNQTVLGRAPFGRYGSVVPGVAQFLLTMGWSASTPGWCSTSSWRYLPNSGSVTHRGWISSSRP